MATAAAKSDDQKTGDQTPPPAETPEAKAAAEKAATDKAAADKATADKATADAEAAAAAAAAKPKAPEKYALKLPEHNRVSADDLARLEQIARAQDWTNEQAQELLEAEHAELEARHDRFATELRADPDYGGDKLETTAKYAQAAMDRFRPAGTTRGDSLRAFLSTSGYGDNAHWVSLMADIGKAMAEDTPPHSGSLASGDRDKVPMEERIYRDKKK